MAFNPDTYLAEKTKPAGGNNEFAGMRTTLDQPTEAKFQSWKSTMPPRLQSDSDYDLRGFYKKNPAFSLDKPDAHMTDEFKLPNHPTFSNESRYYNDQTKHLGGHWMGDVYVPNDGKYKQLQDETPGADPNDPPPSFLVKKSHAKPGGFDPDAYLAGKAPTEPKQAAQSEVAATPSIGQAVMRGVNKYLPFGQQIEAAGRSLPVIGTGKSYGQNYGDIQRETADAEAAHPVTSVLAGTAGGLAGMVLPGSQLANPVARAAVPLAESTLQGAASGASSAAAEGKPLLPGAARGGTIGAALGSAVPVAAAGIRAIGASRAAARAAEKSDAKLLGDVGTGAPKSMRDKLMGHGSRNPEKTQAEAVELLRTEFKREAKDPKKLAKALSDSVHDDASKVNDIFEQAESKVGKIDPKYAAEVLRKRQGELMSSLDTQDEAKAMEPMIRKIERNIPKEPAPEKAFVPGSPTPLKEYVGTDVELQPRPRPGSSKAPKGPEVDAVEVDKFRPAGRRAATRAATPAHEGSTGRYIPDAIRRVDPEDIKAGKYWRDKGVEPAAQPGVPSKVPSNEFDALDSADVSYTPEQRQKFLDETGLPASIGNTHGSTEVGTVASPGRPAPAPSTEPIPMAPAEKRPDYGFGGRELRREISKAQEKAASVAVGKRPSAQNRAASEYANSLRDVLADHVEKGGDAETAQIMRDINAQTAAKMRLLKIADYKAKAEPYSKGTRLAEIGKGIVKHTVLPMIGMGAAVGAGHGNMPLLAAAGAGAGYAATKAPAAASEALAMLARSVRAGATPQAIQTARDAAIRAGAKQATVNALIQRLAE